MSAPNPKPGSYDPFARGPYAAAVRSFKWLDGKRDRRLPVDVWYPATDSYFGQDLDEKTRDTFHPFPLAPRVSQNAVRDAEARPGPFALIAFSHGFGGVRTQSTHFYTHLASHGYVVVAMDHVGNTALDMMQAASKPPDSGAIGRFMEDRPKDLIFAIDEMLAGRSGLEIDPARIGVSGHSFGGWTTLNVAGSDPRIRAALPLAPAGGATPLSPGGVANVLSDGLDLAWERSVPTLYLLAEFDTLLPLAGMRDLVARTREPRIAVVLRNSDHFHFCDRVEQTHDMFSKIGPMLASGASDAESKREITDAIAGMKSSTELCPGEHAYAMTCGLGLAHMDAHVRDDERAISLLQGDLVQLMSARGVEVSLL